MKHKEIFYALPFLLLLSGCGTSGSYLAQSSLRERNYAVQREQQRRAEEMKRERFRIEVNRKLSDAAAVFSLEIYKKLGRGDRPSHTFSTSNVRYNYSDETADCPIEIQWIRKRKVLSVSGYLHYLENGRVMFVCTDTQNIRSGYSSYIKKLSNGIICE